MHVVKTESSESVSSVELGVNDKKIINPVMISSSDSAEELDENDKGSDELFQVEEILGMKYMKDQRYFKVRWQDYGSDNDTWEPENHLRENPNLVALIEDYIAQHGDVKPKVTKRRSKEEKKPHYEEESVSDEEDWFGIKPDDSDREKRNLYVADRIPSFTEKILSQFDPGVRVLRNHLRASYGDSPSSRSQSRLKSETPSSVSSSVHNLTASGGDRRRSAKKGAEKKLSSTPSPTASRDVSEDSIKMVRKRFVSTPKPKINDDIFTCDDNDEGSGSDSSKTKRSAMEHDKQTAGDAVKPLFKVDSVQDDKSKKLSQEGEITKKKTSTDRKSKKDGELDRRAEQPKKSESIKSKKRRNKGDKLAEELQNKIKRSSVVGIMNLACRRTTLESEKKKRRKPQIPSDMEVDDEQSSFIKQLVEGKLKPAMVKPDAGDTASASSSAASSKVADKSTFSKSYTPATSSSLYKPRPYKSHLFNQSGRMATSGNASAANEMKRSGENLQTMQKVSKTLSSGTIIDSLIPVQSAASTSSSSGSSNASAFSQSVGKGNISGAASPPPILTPISTTQRCDFAEQMRPKLNLPMECRPLTKTFEQIVTDRMAQIRLTRSEHLSQQEFDAVVLEGNVERVRAALSSDENKPDLNAVAVDGGTLLHKVCERKCEGNHAYCDIIELLVRNGARMDMREPRDGGIPLHSAVIAGRLCHVRKLLALHSPVNLADYADRTPLITALERVREEEYVNALLKAGSTFQSVFRYKNLDKKTIYIHQKHLQTVFERAIATVFSNVKTKPISPIFVNALHDGRELEHLFTVRDLAMPASMQAYAILICLCNMNGEKYEGRMFGYTPVMSVCMNDRLCKPLTKFVYLATPKNNQNALTIELDAGLVMALTNAGLASTRLGAAKKFGSGDRPSEFTCANLRLLTQVYQLQFIRQASGSLSAKIKYSLDGSHHHQ